MRCSVRSLFSSPAVGLLLCVVSGLAAGQEPYVVTNLEDAGPGSLRAAIAAAEDDFQPIVFADGLQGTITLSSGPLFINGEVEVRAPQSQQVSVTSEQSSVFMVFGSLDVSGIGFTQAVGELGGAVENYGRLTVTDCTFFQNRGPLGGAILNMGPTATAVLNRCAFIENQADESPALGGAICNVQGAVSVSHSIFNGNSAGNVGGAIANAYGTCLVADCSFSGNGAQFGGAVANEGGELWLTNCSLAANAADSGSGIGNYSQGEMEVRNCILWGDATAASAPQIDNEGLLSVSFSNVQGGWSGQGNIDLDPGFIQAPELAAEPFSYGNLRLSAGSPCIDAGDNAAAADLTTDLDGGPRFVDGDLDRDATADVDMGAYEFQPEATCDVAELIRALLDLTDAVVNGNPRLPGNGLPLRAKLRVALRMAESGRPAAAGGPLGAYIHVIGTLHRLGRLSADDAAGLSAAAREILQMLPAR